MTTVVIHDNKVYADGQSTSTMITSYNVKKIVNIGKAILVGAGRYAHVCKFHDWAAEMIEAGHAQEVFPHVNIGMPEKMVDDDFLGAILYPDGTVVLFEGCDNYYEVEQPVFLGSGSDYAAGAIHAGADGVTAIEVAIKLDPYTGGEIQVEGFEEEPEPLTKEQMSAMSKDEILAVIFGEDEDEVEDSPSSKVPNTFSEFTKNTGVDVIHNKTLDVAEINDALVIIDKDGNVNFDGSPEFHYMEEFKGDIHFARILCDALYIEYKASHNCKVLVKKIRGFIDKVVFILNQK